MPTGIVPGGLFAVYNLNSANNSLSRSINRLSSGSRLANPDDDPAGIAVSSRFDSGVKRLSAASQSAQTLISFAQTADGFLETIEEQLTRMSELATKASNSAFSASDRANYSVEFENLTTNITSQVTNAKFNGAAVFGTSGTVSASVSQDANHVFSIALRNLNDASGGSLNGVGALNITTLSGASAAVGQLTTALANIATDRANMNADVSSLNFLVDNIEVEKLNLQTASSVIKDLDFAAESVELAKFSIISEAAAAMVAQANTRSEVVLQILQN
jgi:flagellin